MSNPDQRNVSNRGRVKSALERLDSIEQDIPRLVAGVNGGFANVEQRLNENTEIMNACAQLIDSLIGDSATANKVTANRIERATQLAEQQKAGVEAALAKGTLKVSDQPIGEKSLVIAQETDKDGKVIPPGRMQMEAARIIPAFKEKFMGGKVGTAVDVPQTGGKLTVTEVYEFVDPPPQAANADAPTDTATDASTAPAEAAAADAPAAEAAASTTDGSAPAAAAEAAAAAVPATTPAQA